MGWRREIPDDEVKQVRDKLSTLREGMGIENESLFPIAISEEKCRKVADYLNDKEPHYNEIEAWDQLSKGNYFGYSIFVHEATEIEIYEELVRTKKIANFYKDTKREDIRIKGHGAALAKQFQCLKEYLASKGLEIKSISQLCFCDIWEKEGSFDFVNTAVLLKYLKETDLTWYNKEVGRAMQSDEELRLLMDRVRDEEAGVK